MTKIVFDSATHRKPGNFGRGVFRPVAFEPSEREELERLELVLAAESLPPIRGGAPAKATKFEPGPDDWRALRELEAEEEHAIAWLCQIEEINSGTAYPAWLNDADLAAAGLPVG